MDNQLLAEQSQAEAEQKKEEEKSIAEQKLEQIKEPIQLIGSELLTSGINGVGSYLTKKTGIQAFQSIGDNIKKNGFEKGFTDTLGKAQKEIENKGSKKLNQALKEVENKKKDIQKAVEGKVDEAKAKAQTFKTKAEKDLEAGRKNFQNKINKNLQNQGKRKLKKITSGTNLKSKIQEAQKSEAGADEPSKGITKGEQQQIEQQYNQDIKDGKISSKNPRQYYNPEENEELDDETLYKNLQERLKPLPTLEETQQDINPITNQALNKSKINKLIEPEYNEDDLYFPDGSVKGDKSIADTLDENFSIGQQRSYIQNQFKLTPDPKPNVDFDFRPKRITETQLKKQREIEAQKKGIAGAEQEDLSKLPTPKDLQGEIEELDNVPNSILKHQARKQQVLDQLNNLGKQPEPVKVNPESSSGSYEEEISSLIPPTKEKTPNPDLFKDIDDDPEAPDDLLGSTQGRVRTGLLDDFGDAPVVPQPQVQAPEPQVQAPEPVQPAPQKPQLTQSETITQEPKDETPKDEPPTEPIEEDEDKGLARGLGEAGIETEELGGGPEDPVSDILSLGLGIGSLIASAFEKPHQQNNWTPTLQSSQQFGTTSS